MDMHFKKVEKIISELEMRIKNPVITGLSVRYIECGYKKDNTLPPVTDDWCVHNKGERLGGYNKHFWLHTSFKTGLCPKDSELRFTLSTSHSGSFNSSRNPQSILYINGKLVQGLDLNHIEYDLEPETEYDVYIYLYTGLFNAYYDLDLGVISVNKIVEKLYYDMLVPFEAADCCKEGSYERNETIKHLSVAANMLDLSVYDDERFYASAERASKYLDEQYYGKHISHPATIDCIGHTHIDVAWMWTYAQTREKVQRSFSTVVRLMEKYPEYTFMISQPQLLEYLKEEAPEIYEQVKELVKQGRIEVEGAMWLESDCIIPSGESLVRQIIWGKRFFKDEFGIDSKILWLPDVFGYSAALPQILKKSGVDKFVTSKISWNETNQMPYDVFWWQGIDGSEVMSHFITTQSSKTENVYMNSTSYCPDISPEYILGTWNRFQQKEFSDETFAVYGFGDGGGGPTAEMLERLRRTEKGIIGIPQTRMTLLEDSLTSIESKFIENSEAMNYTTRWRGELYLEFHRGTYTGVAKVKKYNRDTEFMLQNSEKLSVINMLAGTNEYPEEALNSAWKTVLTNQFHDVIPGSSIEEVYDEVFDMYDKTQSDLSDITNTMLSGISENVRAEEGELIAVNMNGFAADGVVETENGCITVKNVPSTGWKVISAKEEKCNVIVEDKIMENEFFKVSFDDNYDIVSIYDKQNDREVIKAGAKANEFRMYEDLPYSYDAWEHSSYYKEKMYTAKAVSCEKVYEGARAGLKITKRFNDSTIIQTVYMYNCLDRIDFKTYVDWHQRHIIFKCAFPVDVNTDKAVYDIQFGNIERTHNENTSWDTAKFETCAHKWADISDGGYGLALMNDCKYGYSVVDGSTIQLSLIRGANCSDDITINDQGEHEFSYSIIPHKGDFRHADIPKKALEFNNPLKVTKAKNGSGKLGREYSFISTDNDNVIIDTVKKAENSDAVIVRLYDCFNIKGKVTLKCGFGFKRAYLCDLLENKESELKQDGECVSFDMSNYEIITIMFEL